jgi:hypothetical protein
MTELEDRLRRVDLVPTPDLADRIRESARDRPHGSARPPVRETWGRRLVVALVAFGVFAGAGVFAWRALGPSRPVPSPTPSIPASGGGPVEYLPLRFVDTDWHVRNGKPVEEGSATSAWASNVAFDERDLVPNAPAIPPWTIMSLPPNGVVVTALATPWSYDPAAGPFPPGGLGPFALSTARVRGPEAEEPPGNYAIYEIGGPYVVIRVYFGGPEPSRALLDQAQATLDALAIPPVCPMPAEGPLGADVVPSSGVPGDRVVVTGPMPFQHEDGSYDTGSEHTRMIAWWNADPSDWEQLVSFGTGPLPDPAGPGPLLRMGDDGENQCSFSIPLEIRDVPPGDYSILVLQEGGSGTEAGATLEAAVTFRVIEP